MNEDPGSCTVCGGKGYLVLRYDATWGNKGEDTLEETCWHCNGGGREVFTNPVVKKPSGPIDFTM